MFPPVLNQDANYVASAPIATVATADTSKTHTTTAPIAAVTTVPTATVMGTTTPTPSSFTIKDMITDNHQELVYLLDNDIWIVFAMGCDILDPTQPNGGYLSPDDVEPYLSYHKPSEIKVTVKYYQQIVERWAILVSDPTTKRICPKQ